MSRLAYFVLLPAFAVACGGSSGSDIPNSTSSSGGASSGGGSSGGASSGGTTTDPSPTSPAPAADASSCESATAALCKRACSCGEGGRCMVRYGTVATEEHATENDCVNYYRFMVCADAKTAAAFDERCRTALASVACEGDGDRRGAAFPIGACPTP